MFLEPILPSYDPEAWAKLPFPERSRLVCASWGAQGYGSPIAVYLAYAVKIAGYIAGSSISWSACTASAPPWLSSARRWASA